MPVKLSSVDSTTRMIIRRHWFQAWCREKPSHYPNKYWPGTGEFPAHKWPVMRKMFPLDDVIMTMTEIKGHVSFFTASIGILVAHHRLVTNHSTHFCFVVVISWVLFGFVWSFCVYSSGPLLIKRTDSLPPNHVKSRSREIGCYNDRIAPKFNMYLGRATAEVPSKFQSDW